MILHMCVCGCFYFHIFCSLSTPLRSTLIRPPVCIISELCGWLNQITFFREMISFEKCFIQLYGSTICYVAVRKRCMHVKMGDVFDVFIHNKYMWLERG